MTSIQPLSSAAFASLLWEIDSESAEDLFGDSPFTTPGSGGSSAVLGRLASVLALLRDTVVPRVWASLNTSEITVIRRTKIALDDDPLGVRYSTSQQTLYAVVSGPTVESMAQGLLEVSDYEVLIPATTLIVPLGTNDAISIDGITHDIVGIRAHPKIPSPVAYRYLLKRAA